MAEGSKEDKAIWTAFLRHLKERGLNGVWLFASDKCLGLVESLGEFYPEALWQRCAVHFYRNVWTAVPTSKVAEGAAMLRACHIAILRAAFKANMFSAAPMSAGRPVVLVGRRDSLREPNPRAEKPLRR